MQDRGARLTSQALESRAQCFPLISQPGHSFARESALLCPQAPKQRCRQGVFSGSQGSVFRGGLVSLMECWEFPETQL